MGDVFDYSTSCIVVGCPDGISIHVSVDTMHISNLGNDNRERCMSIEQ